MNDDDGGGKRNMTEMKLKASKCNSAKCVSGVADDAAPGSEKNMLFRGFLPIVGCCSSTRLVSVTDTANSLFSHVYHV